MSTLGREAGAPPSAAAPPTSPPGTRATSAFGRQGARYSRRARPWSPRRQATCCKRGSGSGSPHRPRAHRSHMLCIRLHIIHFNVNLRKSPPAAISACPCPTFSSSSEPSPHPLCPLCLEAPCDKSQAFLWLHLSKLAALSFLLFPLFLIHLASLRLGETQGHGLRKQKGPELQISRALILISLSINLHVKNKNLAICQKKKKKKTLPLHVCCLPLRNPQNSGPPPSWPPWFPSSPSVENGIQP